MASSSPLTSLLLLPLLLLAHSSRAEDPPGGRVDILGTWYVLIHYTDDNTTHPERVRWDDRVWVFEKAGSRIKWQQYPIVIFDDEYGRFERRSTGQYARILGAWEPNESQLGDIRDGLQVNDRGSKRKTLRGSDEAGWKTNSRARPGSASVISYTENWTIEGLPDGPVFERRDSMGGERTDSLDGVTRFASTRVLPSGNRLRGTFERDGTRHGTFRMMRSGSVGGLKKAATSQSELQQRAVGRQANTAREDLSRQLTADLERRGVTLQKADVDELADQGVQRIVGGSAEEEVVRQLADSAAKKFFAFADEDAEHDDAVRYALPFDDDASRTLRAGVGAEASGNGHVAASRYSFDFEIPTGTRILAARPGIVKRVDTGYVEFSRDEGRMAPSHVLYVLHDDGTYAIYGHLESELAVEQGDRVDAGQWIGVATGPHLHFGVIRNAGRGRRESVDIRFDDGSPGGFVPKEGLSYGGKGGD